MMAYGIQKSSQGWDVVLIVDGTSVKVASHEKIQDAIAEQIRLNEILAA